MELMRQLGSDVIFDKVSQYFILYSCCEQLKAFQYTFDLFPNSFRHFSFLLFDIDLNVCLYGFQSFEEWKQLPNFQIE